ncbi:MAG: hypothetical protein ABIG69_09245 [Bacteroidota bacterium]
MKDNFLIVTKNEILKSSKAIEDILSRKKLYKSLSLFYSSLDDIFIPPTILLLEFNPDFTREVISRWKLPLMIRMDYEVLPQNKTLGGIPIYNYKNIKSVSNFLFKENCYPVLHTHIDRFQDLYSVGILLNKNDYNCLFEIVGEGFDASDLRLGSSLPHETIEFNLLEEAIVNRNIISDKEYEKDRIGRQNKIYRFKKYIDFVNKNGYLLSSLERFNESNDISSKENYVIPKTYKPISRSQLKTLSNIAFMVKTKILPKLPVSEFYVASFSLTLKTSWVLWDIYGSWYKR